MICVNALAYREKNLLLDRFVCGLRVGTRGSESMSKGTGKSREPNGRAGYKALLRELQIELVKLRSHIIKHGHRVLVIFEGRDASGKDGTIKRTSSISAHARRGSWRSGSRPTRIAPPGTFSAMSRICRRRRSWSCSIAVGTTGRASNG